MLTETNGRDTADNTRTRLLPAWSQMLLKAHNRVEVATGVYQELFVMACTESGIAVPTTPANAQIDFVSGEVRFGQPAG